MVDVIIKHVLTNFRVILLTIVSDFLKGSTRGKVLDHDERLQSFDKGVVMAGFQFLTLFFEKFLSFSVCYVRTSRP